MLQSFLGELYVLSQDEVFMNTANNNNTLPMNYTMQVMPTYVVLEQKKLLDTSLVELNSSGSASTEEIALEAAKSENQNTNKSEFGGLMPAWMLAMGEAEYSEEQFNGSNGIMGKYLLQMAKISTLQEAFSAAISALGSFGALKDYLQDNKGSELTYWQSQGGDSGAFAPGLLGQILKFHPHIVKGGPTLQEQQQEEFGVLTKQSGVFQDEGSGTNTFDKELQNQGATYLSDDGTIGSFIAQISQDFDNLGVNQSSS